MTNLDKIATHPLQTSFWGKFRREWGNNVIELKNSLLILSKIPRTTFTIGGIIRGTMPTKADVKEVKEKAKENNTIFVKYEPNVLKTDKLVKKMKSLGMIPGRRLFTPQTFWIDLTKSEDELLKSFTSKTRYNIRLAQRKGVVVKEDNSDKAFKKYLELTFETASRQGFYAHTPKYHEHMWKILKPAGIAHLMTATYKNEIITTWILFVWKKFLYYPYGASTDKYKNVMANNLMMWEAIKFGKRNKLTTFDLWGKEEGKGFTKFKEGYNPRVVDFLGTWDLVINKPLYYIYRIAENIRWFLLRARIRI